MKKNPFYRRGKGSPNDGFKEKTVWQLSKGPMTGEVLGMALKMTPREVHVQMRSQLRETQTASFSAGEWQVTNGIRDRVYSLEGKPRRVTPKTTMDRKITINWKEGSQEGEENRKKNIIAAQRRARLIAAGLYIGLDKG